MGAPDVVGSFEHVRYPPDLGLGVHQPKLRMTMEDTGEQEVGEAVDAVADEDGGRHGVGSVGRGLRCLGARADVHAQDRLRVGAGGEERLPLAAVDAGQAEVGRQLRERHRPYAAVGVAVELGDGEVDVPQRDQAERDEPAAG